MGTWCGAVLPAAPFQGRLVLGCCLGPDWARIGVRIGPRPGPGPDTRQGQFVSVLGRSGSDLLSRVLRRSTIGARGFHGRVRDGIGCLPPAITTRSSKHAPPLLHSKGRNSPVMSCGLQRPVVVRDVLSFLTRTGRAIAWLFAGRCRCVWWADQADRAISTSQLNVLPRLHPWPIDVMVYHGSQARPGFEGGFPLRCFQRLSRPYIATLRCRWRDNRYTRGTSIPVLSY